MNRTVRPEPRPFLDAFLRFPLQSFARGDPLETGAAFLSHRGSKVGPHLRWGTGPRCARRCGENRREPRRRGDPSESQDAPVAPGRVRGRTDHGNHPGRRRSGLHQHSGEPWRFARRIRVHHLFRGRFEHVTPVADRRGHPQGGHAGFRSRPGRIARWRDRSGRWPGPTP